MGFVNFYQYFIQGFNKIAIPLISIFKTTGSSIRLLVVVLNILLVLVNRVYQKNLIKSKNQNLKSGNLVKSGNSKARKELKFLTSKAEKVLTIQSKPLPRL